MHCSIQVLPQVQQKDWISQALRQCELLYFNHRRIHFDCNTCICNACTIVFIAMREVWTLLSAWLLICYICLRLFNANGLTGRNLVHAHKIYRVLPVYNVYCERCVVGCITSVSSLGAEIVRWFVAAAHSSWTHHEAPEPAARHQPQQPWEPVDAPRDETRSAGERHQHGAMAGTTRTPLYLSIWSVQGILFS